MGIRKVVLISGCSSGFGRLMAEALPLEGYTVYATMRNTKDKNSRAKSEIEALAKKNNYDLQVIEMDVTSDESVYNAVTRVVEETGRIDVFINNAGAMNNGITEAFSVVQVKTQFDVNFFASVRTCRAVLPHMRRQKSGLLIQISSLAGRAVFPFFGIYCASKFAVEALAEAYHYELKKFGINSVIVEPGPFATGLFRAAPRPADSHVEDQYADISQVPGNLLTAFEKAAIEDAPEPLKVIEAVNDLICMPDHERPLRTIVANYDFDISKVNEIATPVQRTVLEAMGLEDLIR